MLFLILTLATSQYPVAGQGAGYGIPFDPKIFVPLPDPFWAYTIGQQKYNEEQLAELKSYAKTAERRAQEAEIFELKKLIAEQQIRLSVLSGEGFKFDTTAETEPIDPDETEAREVMQKHCIGCHNSKKSESGLDLTKSKFTLGEKLLIADYVESKEMPPKSVLPQPSAGILIKWGRKDKAARRNAYRSIGD